MPLPIYYVSISARTIQEEPPETDHLAIQATEKQLVALKRKLDREDRNDEITSLRAVIPFKSAEKDPATEEFSDDLLDLYAYVYELGTPETKAHIESLNLLPKLTNQNASLPGYKS
ncbi:hypothetical protein [Paenibacillus sacheonensis]|uniref:Hydrolase n=1 Tax=Paenibacillus sacheonensis TaxID=742054 RepID=A0A7X4YVR8_9BACL|nr:hypothetical protein [Paenibacillus sacheonensis]MBM7564320.1 hypothetical protein [Paenibacillus sacheonensis]NBC73448.1 hypothetical protein [Paenibacillus sacheonensis]